MGEMAEYYEDLFVELDDEPEPEGWITKTGELVPYEQLGLRHLLNCILMMERKILAGVGEHFWLDNLLDEAERRSLPLPHIFGR